MKVFTPLRCILIFYVIVLSQQYAGPFSEYWTVTDVGDGGYFEGDIRVPIVRNANQWKATLKFDRTIKGFKVSKGDFIASYENETVFEVKYLPWNSAVVSGENLHFGVSGHTRKGLPSVRIRFQGASYGSPEDSTDNILKPGKLRQLISDKLDYEKAFDMSLKFFDAQRSGRVEDDTEVDWKRNSALYDGGSEGLDLTGGLYISGDYVKFNFPMAFAITQLAWGALEFGDAYELTGDMEKLLKIIKWATDYFIKSHPERNVLYGMVGDPEIDHKMWESSSGMTWERPAYKLDEQNPGSDLAGEMSAALAAASILFKGVSPEYSEELLKHARTLFNFADKFRGRYDAFSIPQAAKYYKSTGYMDELVWASSWLYKATGDQKYKNFVAENYPKLSDMVNNTNTGLSYDNKILGIQMLLPEVIGDFDKHMEPVYSFCKSPGGTDAFMMPDGLMYSEVKDGPVHFAANAAFVCSLAATRSLGTEQSERFLNFTKSQVNRILGPRNLNSFMIGFGKNFPLKPHHRDSSCPAAPASCGWEVFNSAGPNINQLDGALVGGPTKDGILQDSRHNYQTNQPNILYNSAFQTALAGIMAHNENLLEGSGLAGSGDLPWDPEMFSPSDEFAQILNEDDIEEFDACVSNPCQHNGECVTIDGMDFFCRCQFNSFGRFCEKKLNPQMEWMTTWETGAQVHVYLPTEMLNENKRLKIVFPPSCPITSVKAWNTCIVPSLSSTGNKTMVFQQVSWQNDLTFIGMTFDFKSPAFYRPCLKTEDFRFKITNTAPGDAETSSYTPKNCPKNIPYIATTTMPTTTSTHQTILPQGATTTVAPTTTTIVQPTKSTPVLIWTSSWGSGGQAEVNVKDFKPSTDGGWSMKFKFPKQCEIASIQFWNGCVVDDQSTLANGLFTLEQLGWQLNHDFIGMTVNFMAYSLNPSDCFNADLYNITFRARKTILNEDPRFCPRVFNSDFDTEESGNPGKQIKLAIGDNNPESVWLSGEVTRPIAGVDGLKATVVAPNTIQLTWKRVGENADTLEITYVPFEQGGRRNKPQISVIKSIGGGSSLDPVTNAISAPRLDISASKKEAVIESLKSGNKYQVKARALEGDILGPPSFVTVTLDPQEITEICASAVNSTAISLSWKKPFGYQTEYEVSYFPEEPESFPASPFVISGDLTQTAISGLLPNSDYVFIVRAKSYDTISNGKYVFTTTDFGECKYMVCANNADCVTAVEGSKCQCKFGYTGDGNVLCRDVNECSVKNECDENALCFNSIGSYKCKCKLGYVGDGYECLDIDECIAYPGVCPEKASCVNKEGSFDCFCEEGYELEGSQCVDVNECESGAAECPRGSMCFNTHGSYTCGCRPGYKFYEERCMDVDECKSKDICSSEQVCVNSLGSYKCLCSKGYKTEKDGSCTDINECETPRGRKPVCSSNTNCKNKIGGFICQCKRGYAGLYCQDVNECENKYLNKCKRNQTCVNISGSYKCT